jgi:hypothetical protein
MSARTAGSGSWGLSLTDTESGAKTDSACARLESDGVIIHAAATRLGDGEDDMLAAAAGVLLAEAVGGLCAAWARGAVASRPGDGAEDPFCAVLGVASPARLGWYLRSSGRFFVGRGEGELPPAAASAAATARALVLLQGS